MHRVKKPKNGAAGATGTAFPAKGWVPSGMRNTIKSWFNFCPMNRRLMIFLISFIPIKKDNQNG